MTDRKQRKRIETERNRNKKIMKVEQKKGLKVTFRLQSEPQKQEQTNSRFS